MSCDNAGGRVSLNVDGVKYDIMMGCTVKPTNLIKEADAAANGNMFVTVKPKPATAEFTLVDRCPLTLDHLVNAECINATIKLIDVKRTYLFSNATVVGEPVLNTENGEITGFVIASNNTSSTED